MKGQRFYNPHLGDCEEFLQKNQRLVWMVMRRTKYHAFVDNDDLFQEGMMGLLRCYMTYDPEKGAMTTHAVANIKGRITNYYRDKSFTIRPTRRIFELRGKLIGKDLLDKTDSEISRILNIDIAEVQAGRDLLINPVVMSLSRSIDEEETTTLEDMVGRIDDQSSLDVEEFMNTLSERERRALELRMHGYVQRDIGVELGISQAHVGRIIKAIGVKYRRFIGGVGSAVCGN
ncbi:sigma-70 family RNA polymerase sigma factor [Paenibacillus hubeiensis]|uniref:sigma-70 family RNA polymerase sigma factor n=1 Tax=Paenibacillus hubeiensis TaxID=3077330 RepID=UPI0031BA6371